MATSTCTALAQQTGGQTFDSNDSDVGQVLIDAINVIVNGAQCASPLTGQLSGGVIMKNGDAVCLKDAHASTVQVQPGGTLTWLIR